MMIDYWTSTAPDRAARIRRGAVVCALLASSPVFPQSAPPPDRVTVESPEPPAPILPQQPGFLDTLGRWLGDSRTKLDEGLKGTQDAIGGIQ